MNARNFLIRGLLAGLIAGLAAFVVGNVFGEPSIDTAISIEEAGSAAVAPVHEAAADHSAGSDDADAAGHSHAEGAEVSRTTQKTWGMATAMIAVGPAVGGIIALVSAAMVGRMGRLRPAQSTAVVALIGFVSVSLVPFLKYPANPPAVGSEDTIGSRTGLFFLYLLVSVVAACAAVALSRYLLRTLGPLESVVIGAGAYLAVVVIAGHALPTVNEIGDFPGDTLWYFRRASMLTLATLWAVLGVALTGLVGRLYDRETRVAERRDLAASL